MANFGLISRRGRTALLAVALGLGFGAACGGASATDECTDGVDNDGDLLFDSEDPGCQQGDREDVADGLCNDGLDNDGDELVDYPADPGCDALGDTDESNEPIAQCTDGRDNDGDELIDYPDDPGCFSPLQDQEQDDCPDGATCPECSNGLDDDGDGDTDYPADQGCNSAAGGDEIGADPAACGPELVVEPLPEDGANLVLAPGGHSALASASCGGAGGAEVAFSLRVDAPGVLVVTTALPGTTADTVLYLRTSCTDPTTEISCNNDAGVSGGGSRIQTAVEAGTYYIVVDLRHNTTGGPIRVEAHMLAIDGQGCSSTAECADGLVCRTPLGGRQEVCTDPVCADGTDDDGDGRADYPLDPGCATADDADEGDDCPDGPNCAACANSIDDDGDKNIDFPADLECASAAQPLESCAAEADPMLVLGAGSVSGTTIAASDDWFMSCAYGAAPDRVVMLTLPQIDVLFVDAVGSDLTPALGIYDASCGDELVCNDGWFSNFLTLSSVPAGVYALVVDGNDEGIAGDFTVNVTGTISTGGRCDGALAASGALTCAANQMCIDGVCAGTLECNDGIDQDGDGEGGFPNDPGCTDPDDESEADSCPDGPDCPACSNGLDDDGDGTTDYPADLDCATAARDLEVCGQENDPILAVAGPVIADTTAGAYSDFNLDCAWGTDVSDRVALVTLPALSDLHLKVTNLLYSVVGISDASCGSSIACGENGELHSGPLEAGTYSLIIDSSYEVGDFTLLIEGSLPAGASCEDPLVDAGVVTCAIGETCKGEPGSRSCQIAACEDPDDDDGDGFAGYPMDPGCTSRSDDSEADDCPSGPGCPACANELDDDSDGALDYPADLACPAASGTAEVVCPTEAGPVQQITIPLFSSTTEGAGDDFDNCYSTDTGSDRVYALNLPLALASLTVIAEATVGVIATISDLTCGDAFACDYGYVQMIDVQPGIYSVIVDSYSGEEEFNLSVRGVAYAGDACTGPLFTQGVITCPANHACLAGTCKPL